MSICASERPYCYQRLSMPWLLPASPLSASAISAGHREANSCPTNVAPPHQSTATACATALAHSQRPSPKRPSRATPVETFPRGVRSPWPNTPPRSTSALPARPLDTSAQLQRPPHAALGRLGPKAALSRRPPRTSTWSPNPAREVFAVVFARLCGRNRGLRAPRGACEESAGRTGAALPRRWRPPRALDPGCARPQRAQSRHFDHKVPPSWKSPPNSTPSPPENPLFGNVHPTTCDAEQQAGDLVLGSATLLLLPASPPCTTAATWR